MPELPEVEVTRRGVAPHIEGRIVDSVLMRRDGLRWPFPPGLSTLLSGQRITHTGRRGKYLLIGFAHGTLIIHLGMSGHLRVLPSSTEPKKHDHFDLVIEAQAPHEAHEPKQVSQVSPVSKLDQPGSGQAPQGMVAAEAQAAPFGGTAGEKTVLRMNDPRRFGAVLWHPHDDGELDQHVLLRGLGVEPLEAGFSGELLYRETRKRSAPIKQVLLAGDIVVGVGNIYACESLFRAGINPKTPASRIGRGRYDKLADAIRLILAEAIVQGGSTLRDFIAVNGQSGYFQQTYFVYDRAGVPCRNCGAAIRQIKQGQRSTFYCVNCQK